MTSQQPQLVQGIFGLALLICMVAGGYYFLRSFGTPIVTAFIAAGVAFGVALISNIVQKKRELEFKIRERKVDAYQKIFDFMRYFVTATNTKDGVDIDKMVLAIYEINYALVMWGNSDAIVRWHDIQSSMKRLEGMNEVESAKTILLWRYKVAGLAAAIRSDLGHSDTNLSTDILADLYMPLKDKDEFAKIAVAGHSKELSTED